MNNDYLINMAIEKMKTIKDPEHNLGHTLDVVEYAKEILKSIKAKEDIVILSCYWHDVGRTQKEIGHEKISAELLEQEMIKLNYPKEYIEDCYNAIINHKVSLTPTTLEGIIVRDADKLGFLGKRRIESCLNNNYHISGIIESLPNLRNTILKLEPSRAIYDRDISNIMPYTERLR